MKTIFYISGDPFQYGGGATVSYNILKRLPTDQDISLVVARYATIPDEITKRVNVIRLNMPKNRVLLEIYDQFIAPFLLFRLRAERVICLNSIVPLLYPKRVDLFFQMRMFYFEELDSLSKKVKNILGKLSARRADNVYCASKDHSNDLIHHLRLKRQKVKVIHLGYDMGNSKSVGSPCKRTNELLFVSVIRPYKNLDGLIRAIILSKTKRPDLPIKLKIIGKPANYVGIEGYMKDLGRLITESGFDQDIQFAGPKSHTEVIMNLKSSKALVFPTRFEGFGLPLLEAMATRTPVICSGVNSLPEIGSNTVTYFDIGEEDALVNAIIDLYENGYEATKLQSAYERACRFDWQVATDALMRNQDFIVE